MGKRKQWVRTRLLSGFSISHRARQCCLCRCCSRRSRSSWHCPDAGSPFWKSATGARSSRRSYKMHSTGCGRFSRCPTTTRSSFCREVLDYSSRWFHESARGFGQPADYVVTGFVGNQGTPGGGEGRHGARRLGRQIDELRSAAIRWRAATDPGRRVRPHHVERDHSGRSVCPGAGDSGAFLVCDASSDFLSRPVAMERYGLLYAGAQRTPVLRGSRS